MFMPFQFCGELLDPFLKDSYALCWFFAALIICLSDPQETAGSKGEGLQSVAQRVMSLANFEGAQLWKAHSELGLTSVLHGFPRTASQQNN